MLVDQSREDPDAARDGCSVRVLEPGDEHGDDGLGHVFEIVPVGALGALVAVGIFLFGLGEERLVCVDTGGLYIFGITGSGMNMHDRKREEMAYAVLAGFGCGVVVRIVDSCRFTQTAAYEAVIRSDDGDHAKGNGGNWAVELTR